MFQLDHFAEIPFYISWSLFGALEEETYAQEKEVFSIFFIYVDFYGICADLSIKSWLKMSWERYFYKKLLQ